MQCFFHPGTEAVGVCAQCHRAVCTGKQGCGRFDQYGFYCAEHSARSHALQYVRFHLQALEMARDAGVKGIPVQQLIARVEAELAQTMRH